MIREGFIQGRDFAHQHRKRILVASSIGLLFATMLFQALYPASRLLPFTNIDGVYLGAEVKSVATQRLVEAYQTATVEVTFEGMGEPYVAPTYSDIGLSVTHGDRVYQTIYPWYLRILPFSVFWAHAVLPVPPPQYDRDVARLEQYVSQNFGFDCSIAPRNAALKADGAKVEVHPARIGGTCQIETLVSALQTATPTIRNASVVVPITAKQPTIQNEQAVTVAKEINARLGRFVSLTADGNTFLLPAATVVSWMDFSEKDSKPTISINSDKAKEYLEAEVNSTISNPAGVTIIKTHDFKETGREEGQDGKTLNIAKTVETIQAFLLGDTEEVVATVDVTPPTIQYERSYSATDTGLAALMQNFADTHSGVYGVSLIELSGKRRHASYQGNTQFITASTYKLFVAYSTLLRVERGEWQWDDSVISGRNLSRCFDDIIVWSDNDCARELLQRIGYRDITNEARAIGATRTTFLDKEGIKSTAEDEALFLSLLYSGQILRQQESRDRLINAMKRNIYRQGIPRGISGSTVADKVGFLDGYLHDAAIVYSPTGTYVLVILTDNASWGLIADLARQLETQRNK